MFDTAFTLSVTQFARSMSFPERIQHRTARNAALESWRARNTGMDALFYDVKVLTAEEIFYLSDAIAASGLIMIVPPSGGPMLTICDSVEEYMLRGGRDVHALAIAGIGGSALGAAAYARNVADALGEPVAAVVSGFGLGDIVNEAIGGSFFFGWLGRFRNDCEMIDEVVGRPRLGAYSDRKATAANPEPGCLDIDTVAALLGDARLDFHLLSAHSKGNLVLSEALHGLRRTNPSRLAKLGVEARIVTFGARIAMPPEFTAITDVMGALDWYGEMNSRPNLETDLRVPMAGHSTNTDMVGSLPVTAILKSIVAHPVPAREIPEPAALPADAPIALPARVVALEIARKPVVAEKQPVAETPVAEQKIARDDHPKEEGVTQDTAPENSVGDGQNETKDAVVTPAPAVVSKPLEVPPPATAITTIVEANETGNKPEQAVAPAIRKAAVRRPSVGRGRTKPGGK